MIFQTTWEQVLDGSKTQTRRLVKPGEYYCQPLGSVVLGNSKHRLKWTIDNTYAVQPGFGQKAVARILITGICKERLQDISGSDAIEEGAECEVCYGRGEYYCQVDDGIAYDMPCQCLGGADEIAKFAKFWGTIHTTPGHCWQDNPKVWVLEHELVVVSDD